MSARTVARRVVVVLLGYLAAAMTSSTVFFAWTIARDVIACFPNDSGFLNEAGLVLSGGPWIIVEDAVLMFVPWCFALWISRRLQWSGPAFWGCSGAIGAFTVVCTLAGLLSVGGSPLTFLEGFESVAESAGVALILSGLLGGVIYWVIAERKVSHKPT
jgi:hypothetical protein